MVADQEFFSAIQTGEIGRVKSLFASEPTLLAPRDEQGISVILKAVHYGDCQITYLTGNRSNAKKGDGKSSIDTTI